MEEINQCKVCGKVLESKRSKTCKTKECKNKWKMMRIKSLPEVEKSCKQCGTLFKTRDKRNNFCSNDCRVKSRHSTMVKKYGAKSITSPAGPRSEKAKKTTLERYNGSHTRFTWLKERGFNNIEEFVNAVYLFCKENNISPNSKMCLKKFNMSTHMTRELHNFGFSDIFYNSTRSSQGEKDLQDYLKSLNITEFETNSRPKFMKNSELDIYIPYKNFAIEYHGLAVHSERPIYRETNLEKAKNKHLEKYKLSKNNNTTLIQVFEDEWRDKPDIIKSIIKSKLKLSDKTVFARNTNFKIVPKDDKIKFFNKNHISGNVKSKITFGLYTESNELICALSIRHTWNKKYGQNVIEISRFCSKLNTSVVGGFSKLLKQVKLWCLENKINKILTYADCRFSTGNLYKKCGFKHVGHTGPNYFYEKNGIREDRFSHKKINDLEYIKAFGNTEREQNNNNGWYAIHDAGSEIFIMEIKNPEE